MYLPSIKRIAGATTDDKGRFVMTGINWVGKKNVEFTAINNYDKKIGSFMLDTIVPPLVVVLQKRSSETKAADSAILKNVEKRKRTVKASKIGSVTHLKEAKVVGKQSTVFKNSSVLTQWSPDQVFEIKPADEKYKTLEWYLLQNTKGAQKATIDPNSFRLPPSHPYYMRTLTGVTYQGIDTFKMAISKLSPGEFNYRYIGRSKPLAPQIFVNGRELTMDEYGQAEAYRIKYFNMPIQKFKKIVLKHMVGTLHGALPVDRIGEEDKSLADPTAQTVSVDRFLLYLTLDESMETDNPGSLNKEIEGYYQARTFYQPPPGAKPSIADYRSTIHWEPNIKTDATGKATVSFYNAEPKTNVRVIVQGVTDKGVPVVAATSYVVK